MFTPWKCGDCGARGRIRHEPSHTAADIGRWTMAEHKRKSPACHQKAVERLVKEARESAQLSPRDRHILITARIKRKLAADSLRLQRKADPVNTRREWLSGRETRKGYAFT